MNAKTKLASLSDYQLRITLGVLGKHDFTSTRDFPDLCSVLGELVSLGCLRVPFSTEDVVVIPERFPIFSDILVLRKSHLITRLMDCGSQDVLLVADSILSGKEALFFAHLFQSSTCVTDWINCQAPERWDVLVKTVDIDTRLLLAPVKSFIIAP